MSNTSPVSGPNYHLEEQIGGYVCGVDEVGRGPWAGPVTTAAVILNPANIPDGLNDSKKLSAKKREKLYPLIMESAQVGFGEASPQEIDDLNILQATHLAMQRAVANLPRRPDHALIDGNRLPELDCPASFVIKGDNISLSIAAASIIAKVRRDFFMAEIAKIYPEYGWESNAGYGTRQHIEALSLVGPSRFHRMSFAPIQKILLDEKSIRD
ncbi:ribonuclease HII [Paremcibacter congregatus]|uniref:Ribonuclease HII n=1 Tax=Paremcibacter congregatus TaxID=2043170 RepID=A0A2G4YV34_9PROT|nr:ribonuclease HII [Paremcibacter congregatus]PHZ86202.1 ribonuclease HII [Paremcibacter congregatus]QDE27168.1 ribonuclease HII [Paremcibacter congregatus]